MEINSLEITLKNEKEYQGQKNVREKALKNEIKYVMDKLLKAKT